ncbi:MAG: small subunit ribosomal protein, partial [Pseudonocardiales bacterium]|nr:small subunit ribosomal protein [Pseudonocardiales bacterium]
MPKPPIRKPKKKSNPLAAAKITYIDYKDTNLLRKFISDRGKIRARRVTGVTAPHQRQIAQAIKNAREIKADLEKLAVSISARAGKDGRLFGS